jgi:ATP-dependent Clp protease ATP-binding subunit ClpA
MSTNKAVLDLNRKGRRAREFEEKLASRIVGQPEAVEVLSSLYQVFTADLLPPHRPIGTLLFLGPTGSGKTRAAEAVAEALFGDERAVIKIDCAEFQHSHDIAKLIGSPPGYVGHRDTAPLLTQENLDRYHTSSTRLSVVLFDEIEKASETLWQLLLGVLDRGTLTLGDNRHVSFSRALVIMTSNLGAQEMSEIVSGRMGFSPAPDAARDRDRLELQIRRAGLDAARRRFSPEFMNRIDKTVVFAPLGEDHLREVLDLELRALEERLRRHQGPKFTFQCSPEAKDCLLREGADPRYGARHLKRAIERRLVLPLSSLVATQQVARGDLVEIDFDLETSELVFSKHAGGAPIREDVPLDVDDADEHLHDAAAHLAAATAIAVTTAVVNLMADPRRSLS